MIQQLHIPKNPALSRVVKFMTYVELTKEDILDGWTAIFPNATTNMMFSLDDDILVNQTSTVNSIYTSCSSTVFFKPYVGMKFMTVQFSGYGLSYVKKIPAHELLDTLSHLDLIFSMSEIDRISMRLKESKSITDKFSVLEMFISKKVGIPEVDPRLPYALDLLSSGHSISIDALSESLCISNRGLQKLFKKHIGMSPSYYRKIIRFNKAVRLLSMNSESSLTQISYACGYFDQAHFIKDFREFGGLSPSEFLRYKANRSDFYNYRITKLDTLVDLNH
ncbi:helix-turn-helix domain-containing protein [Allomuricauda sp.]|uniref:helix-turn-helix domain-containing protein n=1 Tax=Flagellimonas sp. TaxID=2058762 RepID=UPI001B0DE095|nr:helix-turn-helix domain-containing protein [Allomuricauda sp.]MBO6830035.1 AraC family transcriptional regulator [Allomuricauda sp.]